MMLAAAAVGVVAAGSQRFERSQGLFVSADEEAQWLTLLTLC